jgi:outer membrane protein OmpA-like peptidoglycan-associated protein
MLRRPLFTLATMTLAATFSLPAQVPNPTQQQPQAQPDQNLPMPIFRVEVVARTTQAVNYLHRGGTTSIGFQGTPLLPLGKGSAKVESVRGVIHVSAELKNLAAPSSFGPEYLTYVLWAISPDGRPVNLGELTLNDYGNGSSTKIDTTSDIQTFGMIVTAEPYYAVTQPSDVVVMENVTRADTRGVIEAINARYELMPRGMYTSQGRAAGFVPILVGKKDPFELYEAENALQLARIAGAEKYASESFSKAEAAVQQAQRYQNQKPGQKPVITMAREACVRAEDARVIAIRAERQEAAENERLATLARENAAKARADQEAQQRAIAEADRATAERGKAEAMAATQTAQRERMAAEAERRAAEQATRDAQQARQAALEQQQLSASEADKARRAAADADAMRVKAEEEQAQVRAQLLQQFNQILQTTETARGLIVNMSDVLFDTGRYTLKPGAREKLAKLSGIILGHPGLRIAIEGYTDSVGGDEYNMRLSENRAKAVREFLVAENLSAEAVTAQGFGKSNPVADNSSASGRQMNRRVQLVVSGDILGAKLSDAHTMSSGPARQR